MRPSLPLLATFVIVSFVVPTADAATFTIINGDGPGVGFNDATPKTPIGGNPGTTLGEQRINVYNDVAAIWGGLLPSDVEIRVLATWESLQCNEYGIILGSAGQQASFRDFPGAEYPNMWYGGALADKLAGFDQDPGSHDIRVQFNANVGMPWCSISTPFYLGLDNGHGANINFKTVLMHELAHGLGFQSLVNGNTGALSRGFPDIYSHYLGDVASGMNWSDPLETDIQRRTSATSGTGLVWTGANVRNWAATHLGKRPTLRVSAPPAAAGDYDVGLAKFGPPLTTVLVTGPIAAAIDPSDALGTSTTDACSPLTNAAEISGKIALVDRGTCEYVKKAANVQAAGATAMIVINNVAGDPPAEIGGNDPSLSIPTVIISQSDGGRIRANLPAAADLGRIRNAGYDTQHRMFMFAPYPIRGGSSLSHFDPTVWPNVLMEPSITPDITHNLADEATYHLIIDLGWLRGEFIFRDGYDGPHMY